MRKAALSLVAGGVLVALSACVGGGSGSGLAPTVQMPAQGQGPSLSAARGMLSVRMSPQVTIPMSETIVAHGPGVQINLANRIAPDAALRDTLALRTRILPNYTGPSPSNGALLVELAHTGNLNKPQSILSSGSNIWVGEYASNKLVDIAIPADTSSTITLTSGHNVSSVALDASGKLWFSDPNASSYGYISGTSPVEISAGSYGQGISSATLGPNSHMYFTAPTSKTLLDVTTTTPTGFGVVTFGSYPPTSGTVAAGELWLAGAGVLWQCTFTGGALSSITPTNVFPGDSWTAIATGSDGNLYIADQTLKQLIQIKLSGGTAVSDTQLNLGAAPTDMSPGKNGDTDLWVALPSLNELIALNLSNFSFDATITPPTASSLPESVTNTSDDSVWWGENATGLIGTYGDPQTYAAMYGYVTEDSPVPYYGGYPAGTSIESAASGTSITGAGGCLGGFSFTYSPFHAGVVNSSAVTATGSGITGSGTCAQQFSSSHGEQQLLWVLPRPSPTPTPR